MRRKLSNEEYRGKPGGGYACKGWSCVHFRLDPFVAKYCTLKTCKFKQAEFDPDFKAREVSGNLPFNSSQKFGEAWHGNWAE